MANKSRAYTAGQLCNEADNLEATLSNMRQAAVFNLKRNPDETAFAIQIAQLSRLLGKAKRRCERRFDAWCDLQDDEG